MNCSNTTLYLLDTFLKFRLVIEISYYVAILISLTCFVVGYLASQLGNEKMAEKPTKVGIYSFFYSVGALVLIVFLPSKSMIEHVLNCGC